MSCKTTWRRVMNFVKRNGARDWQEKKVISLHKRIIYSTVRVKVSTHFWRILSLKYFRNKKIMSLSVPGLRYLMNAQPSNLCPEAINLSKKCKTIKSSTYSKLQGDLRIGADTRRIPISGGGVHYFVYKHWWPGKSFLPFRTRFFTDT